MSNSRLWWYDDRYLCEWLWPSLRSQGAEKSQRCVAQPGKREWMLGSDVTTQVKWCCLHYFQWQKLVNARWKVSGAERSLAFKRRWRMCSSVFRTNRSWSFVLMQTFSFSFLDRQNTYSCKSDLFANFSAVYIFPCTLNGDNPQFLFQSAVADDDGHLILFECASLSWAFLPLQKTAYVPPAPLSFGFHLFLIFFVLCLGW